MPRPVPKYIEAANIRTPQLRYRWDDWRLEEFYGDLSDEDLIDRIDDLSYRASVAMTIACAEWVVHRFDAVSNDRIPHQYVEAAWAAVVDEKYLSEWQPPDDDWIGPVRGPLSVALLIIRESIGIAVHEDEQAVPVLYIGNLAEHILPDPEPFLAWRDAALERLGFLYPFNAEETLGEVVPREVFDPSYPFRIEMTERLARAFLRTLDHRGNPFLVSPKAMVESGFEGTPYEFSLEEDQRKRVEW